MSRAFNGSSTFLESDTPITAVPLTLACWFRPANITASAALMAVDTTAGSHRFQLGALGGTAGDPVQAQTFGAANVQAITSTGFAANVWNHGCAVFASDASRAAYLNGGGKGTETTSTTPASLAKVRIGARRQTSVGFYFNGQIAEPAIWDVALSDEEVLMLSKGASPLSVRPDRLVYYPSLVRELVEIIGAYPITNTSTTVADHPRIYS